MIKIIVERKTKKGKEGELIALLRQVKSEASLYPGYISGETLYSVDDPTLVLIIATFTSIEAWKEWERRPERLGVTSKIDPLLERPTKVTVFNIAHWYPEKTSR